jgi:AcrR family transcriptional regulator
LIRAAERLMAERGVEAVDLKDIQAAAGQRNRSAVNYYFGDRAGLVAAIIDKHRIALNTQRHELLDELERSGDGSVRSLIEVGVKPFADLLGDPSGRDFMIIVAERASRLGTAGLFAARQRHTDSVARFNRMLFERLSGSRAARELLVARTVLVVPTLLADLARQVNRDEITVAQGRRRVAGIIEFVSRALTAPETPAADASTVRGQTRRRDDGG